MPKISEAQLIEWNRLGLIPGPDESEAKYTTRVEYCLNLKSQVANDVGEEAPFTRSPSASAEIMEKAFVDTQNFYDIAPDWIPLFFSNDQLPPWHGGCAWIFQAGANKPTGAFLQLRSAFSSSPTFLKIYHRDEILTHELCHIGRMQFDEPTFEEFLAYRSSHSPFRRWLGPIVKSARESLLFVLALILVVLLDFTALLWDHDLLYTAAMWTKILPLGMLVFSAGRLCLRHHQLNKCFSAIKELLGEEKKTHGVVYRLTDAEILTFGKAKSKTIQQYAEANKEKSLRWQIITKAYFT